MEVQLPQQDPGQEATVYYFPCQSQSVHFSVKGKRGAVVRVNDRPHHDSSSPGYLIGGFNNTVTALVLSQYVLPPILKNIHLDENKFVDFWMKWDQGRFRLGVGTNQTPVLDISLEEYVGHEKASVITKRKFFGICMTGDNPGTWKINDDGNNGLPPPWKQLERGKIPDGALIAGFENGLPVYVGRRYFGEALMLEKVFPAWIPSIVPGRIYQILSGIKNPLWETVETNSTVPSRALVAGITENGEPVYIGRARYKMGISVRKVEGSGGFHFLEQGEEVTLTPYQVLLLPKQ